MNYDLVIGGVGGQGVLSIAWVLDHAAHEAGLHFKQSEVHGMAQRGGAVSAFVRISDQPVASDLIAQGGASMVLSVEPLEALRYTQLLKPEGWIVTDVTPLVNIDNYPDYAAMVKVLGAAAMHLPFSAEVLERQVTELFAAKGERVVKANIQAFRQGDSASRFAAALVAAGVPSEVAAQVVARIQFPPQPVAAELVSAWAEYLLAADGVQAAQKLFDADEPIALDVVLGR